VEVLIHSNLKKSIAKAVATCLGSGLVPVAPGTFGTAFGLALYVIIGLSIGMSLGDTDIKQLTVILLIGIVLATIAGTICAVPIFRHSQASRYQEDRRRDEFFVFSDAR